MIFALSNMKEVTHNIFTNYHFTFSCEVNKIGPSISQYIVIINFPADVRVLNSFAVGDERCFHTILCRLLSGSK